MSGNGVYLDLNQAKTTLERLRNELCEKMSQPVHALTRMPDQLDTVAAIRDHALLVAEQNMAYTKLQLVIGAIIRINKGEYNLCEGDNCDEEIPVKRLLAIPYAKYCTKCQAQVDGTSYVNKVGRKHGSQITAS